MYILHVDAVVLLLLQGSFTYAVQQTTGIKFFE
jgi:hypothetical protein